MNGWDLPERSLPSWELQWQRKAIILHNNTETVPIRTSQPAALHLPAAPVSKEKPTTQVFKTVLLAALVIMTPTMCLLAKTLLYIGYWMERLESAPFMVAADSQAGTSFICEATLKPPCVLTCAKVHVQTIPRRILAGIDTAASAATVLLWSASIARQNLDDGEDVGSEGLAMLLTLTSTWAETSASTCRHHCKSVAFQLYLSYAAQSR